MPIELYTTSGCPYSAAAREDLEWRGAESGEYDVEKNCGAYERIPDLTCGTWTLSGRGEEGSRVEMRRSCTGGLG